MIREHTEDDQEVRLCNCAGCDKELIGNRQVDALRALDWHDWPKLAWTMYKAGERVKRYVLIGPNWRPFCAECLGAKIHEVVKTRFIDQFPACGLVREVPPSLSRW